MGGKQSRAAPATEADFEWLVRHTKFTREEVGILWSRYQAVSNSLVKDNLIDISEFQKAMGLRPNDFTARIFAAFDVDSSARIDFIEFVTGLHALSSRATISEKAKFCFGVYDIDKNGYVDRNELKEVLLFSLSANNAVKLPEDQLETVIDATFKKMDKNGDGKIELSEFEQEAILNPAILACVNVNIDHLLKPE